MTFSREGAKREEERGGEEGGVALFFLSRQLK